MRFLATTWALLCGLTLPACVPSPGPAVIAEVTGTVIDRETGEGLPGATLVFAYRDYDWWGEGAGWYRYEIIVTTDASGRFAIRRHLAPSLWMWLFRFQALHPRLYHATHGRTESNRDGDHWQIETSLLRSPSLQDTCTSSAMSEDFVRRACSPGYDREFPNGQPRYSGETDDNGERHGD